MKYGTAIIAAVTVALPSAGHAHALLRHAMPAVGATLHGAPTTLSMQFSEGVEPTFSTITVVDAVGQHFEQGKPQAAGDPTQVAEALKPLPAGTYTVTWHATSVDTHKTQGSYQFTVAP